MPFFDDDPFGLGVQPLRPFLRPGQAPVMAPDLSAYPQGQADGLLSKLGQGALGGIGWFAGMLDKPGRVLRGGLAGRPRELLNAVPFSDALGLTNHEDRVSGKHLLGLDESDDSWGSTLAGIGAEIATDPLLYTKGPGAALTALGATAKKIGVLPKTISGQLAGLGAASPEAAQLAQASGQSVADVAGQRLGAHIGFGLPGQLPAVTADLTGPLSAAAHLAGYVPGASLAAKAAAPIGRGFKALFHAPSMGQPNALGQEIAPELHEAIGKAQAKALEPVADIYRTLGVEGIDTGQQLRQYTAKELAHPLAPGAVHPNVQAAEPQARQTLDMMRAEMRRRGIPLGEIENYYPQQLAEALKDVNELGGGGAPIRPFSSGAPMLHGRDELLQLPGGSRQMEELWRDPAIRGAPDVATAANHILASDPRITMEQAPSVAKFLRGLSADRQTLFNHPVQALQNYAMHFGRVTATVDKSLEFLAKGALPEAAAGLGSRPLNEVIQKMGLDEHGLTYAWDMLRQHNPQLHAQGQMVHIPADLADAITHSTPMFTVPKVAEPLVSLFDSLTNWFKGGATSPFPAFHIRNLVSSGWKNFISGLGIGDMLPAYSEARQIIAGTHPDAPFAKRLGDLYFTHNVGGSGGHVSDILSQGGIDKLTGAIPGMEPGAESLAGALGRFGKEWVPQSLQQADPRGVRGVFGAADTTFAPVAAGQKLGNDVETLSRLAGLVGHARKGVPDPVAAAIVKAAHVDYGNLTGFERNVMRRLIPFYGWMRGSIPWELEKMVQSPGGVAAQAIRTGADLQQQEGFVPEYLAKGLAIPLGKEEDGRQRFLSQFGLPFEDVTGLVNPRGLGVTAMQNLGALNPLLKAPLEYATGKQFFSGRDLDTLSSRGLTGNTLVDQALMNSPAARAITTGRQLADPAKWDPLALPLNLGTGAKVTDVDMARQRHIEARTLIEDALRGSPNVRKFEELYAPAELRGNLSQREVMMLRLYRSLVEEAQSRPRNVGVQTR